MANTFQESRASLNIKPGGSNGGQSNRNYQNSNQGLSQRNQNQNQDGATFAIKKYNQETQNQGIAISLDPAPAGVENINPSQVDGKPKKLTQQISGIEQDEGLNTQKPLVEASGSNFVSAPSTINQHLEDLKKIMTTAVPPGSTYRVQLLEDGRGYQFIDETHGKMAFAFKRFSLSQTVFDFSVQENEGSPEHSSYIGRITGNFLGSKFDFTDKPDAFSNLTVQYDASCSLEDRPIRSMRISHIKYASNGYAESSTFVTDLPKFDLAKNTWHMNLQGRALQGSVNNFRLLDEKDKKKVFLMGKVRDGCYNIDVCHPLTPVQAFGIAVSSVTYKWCTK